MNFFSKKYLKRDVIAGMSVAFILIPQSMAYATLAGLPLQVGLYTACIPVMIAAIFWASKQMSTGPVTIISLMTASALAPLAGLWTQDYIVYASLLALFIWIFYLILWVFKMWILAEFLSHPVIVGFTNAIAIITLTSQLPKMFGVWVDKGSNFLEFITNLIQATTSNTHVLTLLFGLGAVTLLITCKYFFPKLPRILITLVLSIFVSYIYQFWNFGGAIVGNIPTGLPALSLPFLTASFDKLSITALWDLAVFAMIIGLIGFTETMSVAKLVATQNKQRVQANRELWWQWLANISSGLFGGYGVAGSFSKTAVNLRAGAQTKLSSIVTAILVCVTLLWFTPLLYHLPMATLAAIIIVSVASLIRIQPIITSFKLQFQDGIVAVITFVWTLVLSPDIEAGLLVWVILSLVFFIYRTMKPKILEVARYQDGMFRWLELFGLKWSKKISIIKFDGDLYFANAGYFEDRLMQMILDKPKLKFLIIDLSAMTNMDSSGYEVFEKVIQRFEAIGIHVYVCHLKAQFIEKFAAVGFIKRFGKHRIFSDLDTTLDYIAAKHKQEKEVDKLDEFTPDKNKKNKWDKNLKKIVSKMKK